MMSVMLMHDTYNPVCQSVPMEGSMGHSQSDKAQSRERILTEAAAQIREGGLESVSVARLMRSVNLTHGGFYGHFASRSELLAEALERALADGAAASRAAAAPLRAAGTDALVRSYLSRSHRDSRKQGCAVAALASDVARADEPVRAVMAAHLERFIARVAASQGSDEDEAMLTVSALVGGLLLSRVLTDPKRSDALLRAVKNGLTRPKAKLGPTGA